MCKYILVSVKKALSFSILISLLWLATASVAGAQQESALMKELNALPWQRGPSKAKVGPKGVIKIPVGHKFLDSSATRRFLELNGNPPQDNEYTLAPNDFTWFAIFRFNPVGYVKDDEKINADDLLKTLKSYDEPENKERERLGMSPLYTVGWSVAPHYDLETKRLEWGINLKGQNEYFINYKTRILGRSGVMEAILVADPASLDRDVVAFKNVLRGFHFVSGEQYAEFRSGDKVAEYGLAALIVGGAAAAAAKSGFGKLLGKLAIGGIAVAAIAVIAFFKRLTRRLFRKAN